MNFIPNPLHPALVHFPIVLILLGTLVAIPAIFLRRWQLPQITACLLLLGAIGSVAATWSGEEDQEKMKLPPQAEQIMEEHEEWGESARNLALLAAAGAVAAAVLGRFPKACKGLSGVTALAAVAASFCVMEAGHYGGKLVYLHGVGLGASQNTTPRADND